MLGIDRPVNAASATESPPAAKCPTKRLDNHATRAPVGQFDQFAGDALSLKRLVIEATVFNEHAPVIHGMRQEGWRGLTRDLAFAGEALDVVEAGFLSEQVVTNPTWLRSPMEITG